MERIGYVFSRRSAPNIVGLLIMLGIAGCDDPFEDLDNREGAATLYTLSRPEHVGYPSALSLAGQAAGAVVVEDAGSLGWDVALTGDDGEFMLVPGGAFVASQGNGAVYMVPDRTFEEVTEAPRDGRVFNDSMAVPLRLGAVYVIRSRSARVGFSSCSAYFSKLRATEIDAAMASARLEYIVNPNCNARGLEPPPADDGEDD